MAVIVKVGERVAMTGLHYNYCSDWPLKKKSGCFEKRVVVSKTLAGLLKTVVIPENVVVLMNMVVIESVVAIWSVVA